MAHTLSLLQSPPYASGYFVCNLCWEKGSGPVYHCPNCDFDLHINCAAMEEIQTHFTHFEHPLHLKPVSDGHSCDGCGEDISKWVFRCDLCDYDMHSLCVRAPRFIVHRSHSHVLTLFNACELSGSCRCDGCGNVAPGRVYRCSSCNYDLHQSCATLPLKVNHRKHSEHHLILLFQPPNGRSTFTCNECEGQGIGWVYHCPLCRFNLHPRCANISHDLPHISASSSHSQERNLALTTPAAMPVSKTDLEAAERVLSIIRRSIMENSLQSMHVSDENRGSSSTRLLDDEQDVCATCLEGYDRGNPKETTSCGHHFHLSCILEWMERSSRCPICRKVIVVGDRRL